ncbi:MAG: hypothetical protein QM501_08635 [Gimesia sp.]
MLFSQVDVSLISRATLTTHIREGRDVVKFSLFTSRYPDFLSHLQGILKRVSQNKRRYRELGCAQLGWKKEKKGRDVRE